MFRLFVNITLIAFCLLSVSYSQTAKAKFIKEVEVDGSKYMFWYSYVIDSTYLRVWNPDGTLPKRESGTYKYWKAESNGKLTPLIKIDYRLPIFQKQSVVMKKEESLFNNETIEQ